jgi:hypothetical protein
MFKTGEQKVIQDNDSCHVLAHINQSTFDLKFSEFSLIDN